MSPYCKDCESVLQHAHEVEVDLPGRWTFGPNDRMHYLENVRKSRKYPSGLALYLLCGRRPQIVRQGEEVTSHVERET